ncbi:MAG: hypothetical protein ACE366_02680 [Bradymonadia bacterium]
MGKPAVEDLKLYSTDLRQYFVDAIESASKSQRVELDDHTQSYLAELLFGFSDARPEARPDLGTLMDRPVALQLSEAMSAPPGRRFKALKHIGDYCLYLTGFFHQALHRKPVSPSYYMDVGGGAYMRAARSLNDRTGDNPFVALFRNLAVRFDELVEVINAISEDCFNRDPDILRLYDRFLETGEPRLAARLTTLGVVLPGDGAVLQ